MMVYHRLGWAGCDGVSPIDIVDGSVSMGWVGVRCSQRRLWVVEVAFGWFVACDYWWVCGGLWLAVVGGSAFWRE